MKRVLVCDDEPHIVEGLRHLLRAPERVIEIARSGKEALDRIREQIPDLVLLDIMMPEMSGIEVLSELRGSPTTVNLPVVILTAKGQARDANMAQEVWGATVMAKPFNPTKLRELVAATLQGKECPQQCFI